MYSENDIRAIVEKLIDALPRDSNPQSSGNLQSRSSAIADPNEEGVIKFTLNHHRKVLDRESLKSYYSHLESWRNIVYQLKLVGQDKHRYGGNAWGNISIRMLEGNSGGNKNSFFITGTSTGSKETLAPEEYSLVLSFEIEKNSLTSTGLTPPSSESLTHAALYEICGEISSVFHIHHPLLWQNRRNLNIPETSSKIPYGTVEMAKGIQDLLNNRNSGFAEKKIMAMGGHEDGLISFGKNPEEAALTLIPYLAKAYRIEILELQRMRGMKEKPKLSN